jgi:hypothetical protein
MHETYTVIISNRVLLGFLTVHTAVYFLHLVFEILAKPPCGPLFQIAAISPADINFEESLSTLRYGMSTDMHDALDNWPLSVLSCPDFAVQRPGHNPEEKGNVYRVYSAM